MKEPRYTVEPVTQLALFRLGYRFLIVGSREACRGVYRAKEAPTCRRQAEQPAVLVPVIQAPGVSG